MTWWCECMERNIAVCFPTFCSTRLIAYITFLMQTTKHIDLKSGTSYQALGGIFVIHVFLDKHRKIAFFPPSHSLARSFLSFIFILTYYVLQQSPLVFSSFVAVVFQQLRQHGQRSHPIFIKNKQDGHHFDITAGLSRT